VALRTKDGVATLSDLVRSSLRLRRAAAISSGQDRRRRAGSCSTVVDPGPAFRFFGQLNSLFFPVFWSSLSAPVVK
jgi:hypothetical protein